MSLLPDELWRRILEIGTETETEISSKGKKKSILNYKDLCCLSISCRRLHRLSTEDAFWSPLLSSDFPQNQDASSSTSPSSKTLYRIRSERDKARKFSAHRRAVFRIESEVALSLRKLREIDYQRAAETEKLRNAVAELSNLRKISRQASVALNVWQPEVIRGRQKEMVEQCVVPVGTRISAVEMEIRVCKQQIGVFSKAYTDENRRLETAKEQLAAIKYHPIRDYNLARKECDECGIKRKKLKKSNSSIKQGKMSSSDQMG